VSESEALSRAIEFDQQAELDRLLESIMTKNGMSAERAARGIRALPGRTAAPDPFEEAVGVFRRLGMSEAAARKAVIGRGRTEAQARQEIAETARAQIAESRASGAAERLQPVFQAALEAARYYYGLSESEARTKLIRLFPGEMSEAAAEEKLREFARLFGPQSGPTLKEIQERAARTAQTRATPITETARRRTAAAARPVRAAEVRPPRAV